MTTRAEREKRALGLRDLIAGLMPDATWTDGAIVQTSDNECYVSTLVTLPDGDRFRVDVEFVDAVTWRHSLEELHDITRLEDGPPQLFVAYERPRRRWRRQQKGAL